MNRSQNSSFIFFGWQTEKRKVCDLIPCSYNPRKISEEQKSQLEQSLKNFNLVEIPAINTDNSLLAGHHRISILDGFGGSGSTLIACEQLKRKCMLIELDQKYCDVIVTRYEKFTGQKAKLVRS